MLCFQYRKHLIPYSEGSLGEREREKVECHLSKCARCRAELECIRAVTDTLRQTHAPAVEPAPDLWARVAARIEAEPARGRQSRLVRALSACGVVVLAAVVSLSLIRAPEPTRSVPKAGPPVVAQQTAPNQGPVTVAALPARAPRRVEPRHLTRRPRPVMMASAAVNAPAIPSDLLDMPRLAPKAEEPTRKMVADAYEAKPTDAVTAPAPSVVAEPVKPEASGFMAAAAPSAPAGVGPRMAFNRPPEPRMRWADEHRGSLAADMDQVDSKSAASTFALKGNTSFSLGFKGDGGGARDKSHVIASNLALGRLGMSEARRGRASVGIVYSSLKKLEGRWQNDESVVDKLNETEGARVAAMFAYP